MIQKGNEIGNRPLEIDVVLPERVIGIDQERLAKCGERRSHWLMILTSARTRRGTIAENFSVNDC
jgi:hypothetical protein